MEQQVLVFGEPVVQLPKDLFIPPDALRVLLETFSGPLDVLVYLIRKQNFDVLDIPVALITEQYLAYLEVMEQLDMALAAEYLLMAATLAEIKARMLLAAAAGRRRRSTRSACGAGGAVVALCADGAGGGSARRVATGWCGNGAVGACAAVGRAAVGEAASGCGQVGRDVAPVVAAA